ncbi:MAG: NAD-dependent epimerase/dehydratase family protein [Pseudomonadota bacterium]
MTGTIAPLPQGRPILVTGAAGFVAGHVLTALERTNLARPVVAVCRPRGKPAGPHDEAANCDIAEDGAVERLIDAYKPAGVIHLAAIAAPRAVNANRDHSWRVNFEATRRLAEALMQKAKGGRLVFAGSSEAYGESFNTHPLPINEVAPLQPRSAYGATKAAADSMLGQLAYDGLDVVRMRPFNHTGPGQSEAYVAPAFASQIAAIEAGNAEPVVKVGDLSAHRDFLDVRDVADAYVAALRSDSFQRGAAFNIASGTSRPMSDLLHTLLSHSVLDIAVERDPDRFHPSPVAEVSGDTQAISAALAWQPRISFEQMLVDVLDDWRGRAGCATTPSN